MDKKKSFARCPMCNAAPGKPCESFSRTFVGVHEGRKTIAEVEAARLAAEFPRTCPKCAAVIPDLAAFLALPLPLANGAPNPNNRISDVFGVLDLRNHDCGTTLAALVEIRDIEKE